MRSISQCIPTLFITLMLSGFASAMTVTLTPSLPAPVSVGTTVTWTASVTDVTNGTVWYRFRARHSGQTYQVIRDFSPLPTLDWTATDHEGWFEIEVSAKNEDTGDTATVSAMYDITSRISGNQPSVNPTSHPLVFLYSAPPCDRDSRMQVEFVAPNGTAVRTPFKTCDPQFSMNFYLMGLYAETNYTAHHIIEGRRDLIGPDLAFTTGSLPDNLFAETVVQAPTKQISNHVLLGSTLGIAVATDLNGAVIWYGPSDITYITRPDGDGNFWGLLVASADDPSNQAIRKFDATGETLLETNAARVNEQLLALGRRQITGFHHEVRTLPSGRIAALADVEQILTDVQGPGPIDVIGDMVIVFDSQLNVVWTWDTFDHLDVTRKAVLGETCRATLSCAPYNLAADANDWTHGNSIAQIPDGNLLYSSRHQDWLIKINYDNGAGDGHVIWRLGKDGDFEIQSSDPYPWFSHQHDANFETGDPSELTVFDDGNTRVFTLGSGNSRGQVLQLDERKRVASFTLNADLGVYSVALGSAQKLRDGDYFFDAGFVLGPNNTGGAFSIEVDPSGKIVSEIGANALLYRSFRMTSLYTPD